MRLFRSDELNDMGYLNKVKGKAASKLVRSDTFWKGVDIAINFFEPLVNVLRRMDSDVPAMGFLYGYLLAAKNEISERFGNDQSKYKEVFDIIDKRWDSKLKTPLHRAGYYLNPHYYYPNKMEIELDESFREGLITCITKLEHNVDIQDQIISELQQYQDGEGTFGKEIAKRQWKNKNFDPSLFASTIYLLFIVLLIFSDFPTKLSSVLCLFCFCNKAKWWLNHGTSSPNLRKLAARILSLTCSSSACERNWSIFEQVSSFVLNQVCIAIAITIKSLMQLFFSHLCL